MFTKIHGYYTPSDIYHYLFPDRHVFRKLTPLFPVKHVYFYGRGRDALYDLLCKRRQNPAGRHILIPGWGCPIVAAVVAHAGFTPLIMDIHPLTLKMDIAQIEEVAKIYDIDSIILVAENGILYTEDELKRLNGLNLFTIGDYCLAWQNLEQAHFRLTGAEFFSGGLNKPVYGMGLGIMTANEPLDLNPPEPVVRIRPGMLLKSIAMMFIGIPWFYRAYKDVLIKPPDAWYDGKIQPASKNSAAVILRVHRRIARLKERWHVLQKHLQEIIVRKRIKSTLNEYNHYLQGRVLIEKQAIKAGRPLEIHFHRQYRHDLLQDERVKKIDSDYEGVRTLQNDYLAMTLNEHAIKRAPDFLNAFLEALK